MDELITTEADLDWLDDDDGVKMEAALFDLSRQGFHPVPYDAPLPLDGYEYAFYGPLAFSKPKYAPPPNTQHATRTTKHVTMPLSPQPSPLALRERITALHAWYSRNVLALRLTPEVERLWFEWLKAGYNGHDLRAVVLYIRRQISLGKRNEGALKLSNLLERSESGFLKFDEDLGLAKARGNLSVDKKMEPAPDVGVQASACPVPSTLKRELQPSDPARAAEALDQLRKAKQNL